MNTHFKLHFILAFMPLLAAQPAAAEDWVRVAESKEGQVTLIDKDSIKVVDGMVRHWTKLETYSPAGALKGKTILGFLTDCKTETQARTSGYIYENDKLVFSHTEPPDTKLEFKAHPPGTSGASGIAFICRIFKNGWIPFPQLDGGSQWEEVPGAGSYFLDKKSIAYVGAMVRYQLKTALNSGRGYVKYKMASNCADSSSAIAESLSFDVSEKFEPEFSFNLEVERPPLKFHRAETEPGLRYACDHVQTQARLVRRSRKAR